MASIVPTRGLQVIAGRASDTADAFGKIETMVTDDSSVAFVAGDTNLGSPTSTAVKAFDVTPVRTGQTVRHTTTFGATESNFTIKRISLHNATPGSVSGSSNTLVAGIDAQSFGKANPLVLIINVDITYTDNS